MLSGGDASEKPREDGLAGVESASAGASGSGNEGPTAASGIAESIEHESLAPADVASATAVETHVAADATTTTTTAAASSSSCSSNGGSRSTSNSSNGSDGGGSGSSGGNINSSDGGSRIATTTSSSGGSASSSTSAYSSTNGGTACSVAVSRRAGDGGNTVGRRTRPSASSSRAGDFHAVETLLEKARLRIVTRTQLKKCTPQRFFRAFWDDDATWCDAEHVRVNHTEVQHQPWEDHPLFQRRRLKAYQAPWSWQGVSGTSQVHEEEIAFFNGASDRLSLVSTLTMISDVQPYCNSYVTHTLITASQLADEDAGIDIEIAVGATFKKDVGWKVLEDFIRKIIHDIGVDHWKTGRSLMEEHYGAVWASWEEAGLLVAEPDLAHVPPPSQEVSLNQDKIDVDEPAVAQTPLQSLVGVVVLLAVCCCALWSTSILCRIGFAVSFQLASSL